jgi:CelD/BcsL family acetyltransferase involved in cellulose biosynthesis
MSLNAELSFDDSVVAPRDLSDAASQTTVATPRYSAASVSTREAILALKDEWQRLEQVCEGTAVFQAFDVCMPWFDAYVFCETPTHRAQIITFYDEAGVLVALAPFAQKTGGLVKTVEWVGEPLIQYGDILMHPFADKTATKIAFSDTLRSWKTHGLHLRNIRADSRIGQVLDLDGAMVGEAREAGAIDFSNFETVDDYFASQSRKTRSNRRRNRKNLEKTGDLSFEVVKAGAKAKSLCSLALEWKFAWLDARKLSSRAFMDKRALDCLKAAVGQETPTNPFQVFVQHIDGKPAAIEIGLVGPVGNAMYIGTYDPDLEATSVGKVRVESTASHGFAEGWTTYDMLAPMAQFKREWSNTTIGVCDYMVPTSAWGRLYRSLYLRKMRPAMKSALLAMPASLRGLVLKSIGNG